MPKLWSDTIEAHRRTVHDAILDTTATRVGDRGLRSVTMSEIAEQAGIGRATLYKYFPDVGSILLAWHERQISEHLAQLAVVAEDATDAGARLHAVLEAYALIAHDSRGHDDGELAGLLHGDDRVRHAHDHLSRFVRELIADAVRAGVVRDDISPTELVSFCLHALVAARRMPSKAAVRRLVAVTLAGLSPRAGKP